VFVDLIAPEAVATPAGGTWLGRTLLSLPIVALAVAPGARAWARRRPTFVTTDDVRADVERLRVPRDASARDSARDATLARASLALSLAAIALWPALVAMHVAIEVMHAPPHFDEVMPGLALRRMGPVEAIGQLLEGGALLATFSAVAFCIAIARSLAPERSGKTADTPSLVGRFFGGVLLGSALAQLGVTWMDEGVASVALGYAALGLGALVGVVGWQRLFALARRVHEMESARASG
jgi:hypothetical protein